jgi:hypothetical protein
VSKGGNATFTIYAKNSQAPCSEANAAGSTITVHYRMSGNAKQGIDYTLSGTPGKVTIPPGQQSATVILHALNNSRRTTVDATMNLTKPANAKYNLSPPTSATVSLLK